MELKDIPGYEGYYKITSAGAIYSLRSNKWLRPGFVKRRGRNNKQYQLRPLVVLSTNPNDRKSFNVGRLVALTFIPNPNNLPQINHIDGNISNNHFTNIEWCTQSHNIKHAYANGFMKGNHGRNKATKKEYNINKMNSGRWQVKITDKKVTYSLGTYSDINEAIKIRDNFINTLG